MSTKINAKGENREIRIYGDPGAQWALAINENFERRFTFKQQILSLNTFSIDAGSEDDE